VTFTALARVSTPKSIFSRALVSNRIVLAAMLVGSLWVQRLLVMKS
jgi:hypothetical protein